MTKRMIIDATHAEETRVAIVDGTRLDAFDFETTTKKTLKGNIYLGKIIRIEPSLQAAFVEYGGNRHGFLPFSEVHPDYFKIPVADREKENSDLEDEAALSLPLSEESLEGEETSEVSVLEEEIPELDRSDIALYGAEEAEENIDILGGDNAEALIAFEKKTQPHRLYKIQEVLKKRQIVLVQVNKEERGGKGAALTTYISLAGRYCVLMPNASRSNGGVSRKITDTKDRKRLKGLLSNLEIPENMALIVRTAGIDRNKAEIKRDFEYLTRLWDIIRSLTLESSAPSLVYEEGNLIKRAIRDLYTREVDEILVEGDEGYKLAKNFIKMLIPSHSKKVQPYKDEALPLFQKYQVESQIDAMHQPQVRLKSGGYLVINPTEALVAIDVNSGKATRGRHVEETAFKTNLEAAEEVARQLRLRDLAGLIVIDFIDMEDRSHINEVEKRLRDALLSDRARIQMGRISSFGLLELSRQRLRPSIIESSTHTCPRCQGTGIVRSTESTTLQVLRALEEEGIKQNNQTIKVFVTSPIALYLLNYKRDEVARIEQRFSLKAEIAIDDSLIIPSFRLEFFSSPLKSKTLPAKEEASKISQREIIQEENQPRKSNKKKNRRRPHQERQEPRHELKSEPSASDTEINRPTPLTEEKDAESTEERTPGEATQRRFPHQRRRNFRRKGQYRRPVEASEKSGDTSGDIKTAEKVEKTEEQPAAATTPESKQRVNRRYPRRAGAKRPSSDTSNKPSPLNPPQKETGEAPAENRSREAPTQPPASESSKASETPRKRGQKKGWWQRLLDA